MWVPCMRERRQGLGLLLPLLKDSSKDMRTRLPFSFVLFEHSELFPFSGLCQGLWQSRWHRWEWLYAIFTAQHELAWLPQGLYSLHSSLCLCDLQGDHKDCILFHSLYLEKFHSFFPNSYLPDPLIILIAKRVVISTIWWIKYRRNKWISNRFCYFKLRWCNFWLLLWKSLLFLTWLPHLLPNALASLFCCVHLWTGLSQ